jgi:pimeloyl-[acyl-carrier protein] methyl ester esterase
MNALHVEREGMAPAPLARGALPVVMLHGWGMNLRVFDQLRHDLAQAAPAARATWAIDLPGHGRSPWWPGAAAFEVQCDAIIAALPPRCVLVGWSLGAQLAMALAARAPQRVAALVLLAATPRFARAADWPHGTAPDVLETLRAQLEHDWRQVLEDFVWLQVRGSRDAQDTADRLAGALARHGEPDPQALRAGLQLLDGVDLRATVAAIRQPALVVSGLNDRVTRPQAARWLAGALPAAGLLELPRAGHAPFVSHHQEVAAAIGGLLGALSAGAAA